MNLLNKTFCLTKYQFRTNYTYTRISELTNYKLGDKIKIKGWIKGIRNMKEHLFVDVNDGTCLANIQVLIDKNAKQNINYGASIEALGILSHTPRGQLELKADSSKVIGKCPILEGYPFPPKQTYPPEYVRKHLHLRSHVKSFCSMLRVRHTATREFNNYLNDNGFTQIHTPILTSNDCEGAGEVFTVKPENMTTLKHMQKLTSSLEEAFFDRKVFLTVSGQLHLEAMSHGLGNVYTFGPTFRAENSKSPFHLAEFYMIEVEKCFVKSLLDVIRLISDMMKSVTKNILTKSEIDVVNCHSKNYKTEEYFHWLDKEFPVITYEEAIDILIKNSNKLKGAVNAKEGLSKEHELFLTKYTNGPLFVIDWPKEMKPFYMRQKSDNPNIVEALDFLVPSVGELMGGSVREDNYERLLNKLPHELEWYLEIRKFGGITTGGFGMGFERYLQLILNIINIRDVIPLPRWPHNCTM